MEQDTEFYECALVGYVLYAPEEYKSITHYDVRPDDFSRADLATIWELVVDTCSEGGTIGGPTDVIATLSARGKLHDAGGDQFIRGLADRALYDFVSRGSITSYAQLVKEGAAKTRVRQSVAMGMRDLDSGAKLSDILSGLRDTAEREETRLTLAGRTRSLTSLLEEAVSVGLDERYEQFQASGSLGVPFPFPTLMRATNGVRNGSLLVVGAETGQGKTVFAVNQAAYLLRGGMSVYMATYEMTAQQMTDRLLSNWTGIPMREIEGDSTFERHEEIKAMTARMLEEIHECGGQIIINDDPDATAQDIANDCARLSQSPKGLDLFVVDYLGLVKYAGAPYGVPEHELYGRITGSFKNLAKKLDTACLLLVQLKRGASKDESDDEKVRQPTIDDIRGSSRPGHDADMVITITREKSVDNTTGNTVLCVVKSRHSGAGTRVVCRSLLSCMRFEEIQGPGRLDRIPSADELEDIDGDWDDEEDDGGYQGF